MFMQGGADIFLPHLKFLSHIFLESIQPAPLTGQEGLNSCVLLWVNYLSAGLSPSSSPSAASFFPWFVSATREQALNPDFREDNGKLTTCPQ